MILFVCVWNELKCYCGAIGLSTRERRWFVLASFRERDLDLECVLGGQMKWLSECAGGARW